MTTRYHKDTYGAVAQLLNKQPIASVGSLYQAVKRIGEDFADLFAADNPRRCLGCGEQEPPGAVCQMPDEGHRFGGFDRERFLAACGLEPERDPGWPNGECPTCGHTDDHTVAQCNRNLAASGESDTVPIEDVAEVVDPPHRYG